MERTSTESTKRNWANNNNVMPLPSSSASSEEEGMERNSTESIKTNWANNNNNMMTLPSFSTSSKEEGMERISTESIKRNWARIGSVKFTNRALSRRLSGAGSGILTGTVTPHRTLKDVMDASLYVDYMDLKMKGKLGEGAFAKVFQATYLVDGREVAVKMLRHEHLLHLTEVFLFLKEFKTIKHVRHENIVQLIGIGGVQDEDGHVVELFLVQDLCKGGTLRQVVQDQMITVGRKLYSLRTALTWSLEIAKALRYLHRCKPPVVHRDLKLENVILSKPIQSNRSLLGGSGLRSGKPDDANVLPVAKLADFGLATFVDHGMKTKRMLPRVKTSQDPANPLGKNASKVVRLLERMQTLSSFGGSGGSDDESSGRNRKNFSSGVGSGTNDVTGVAGSYGYMAPEVFNDLPYNEKVDVFSFGVMLYNLCYRVIPALQINPRTGETEDMTAYAQRVSTGWRQPLDDTRVPAPVNEIIALCWSQESKDRPSMSDVVVKLEEVMADETVLGPKDEDQPRVGGCCCC